MLKRKLINSNPDFNKIIDESISDSKKNIARNQGFFLGLFFSYLAYLSNDFKIVFYVIFLIFFFLSSYFPELFLKIKLFTPFEKFNNFIKRTIGLIFKIIIFFMVIIPIYFLVKIFKKDLLFNYKNTASISYFKDCGNNNDNLKKYFNLLIVFKNK